MLSYGENSKLNITIHVVPINRLNFSLAEPARTRHCCWQAIVNAGPSDKKEHFALGQRVHLSLTCFVSHTQFADDWLCTIRDENGRIESCPFRLAASRFRQREWRQGRPEVTWVSLFFHVVLLTKWYLFAPQTLLGQRCHAPLGCQPWLSHVCTVSRNVRPRTIRALAERCNTICLLLGSLRVMKGCVLSCDNHPWLIVKGYYQRNAKQIKPHVCKLLTFT